MKIRLNCTTTYFDCAFFVPSICGSTFSPQQTGSTERRPSFATFLAPIFPGAPAPSLSLAGCHKSAIKMMYGPIENGYASSGALSLSLSLCFLSSLFLSVCECFCVSSSCGAKDQPRCLSLPSLYKFILVLSSPRNLYRSIEMCRAGKPTLW